MDLIVNFSNKQEKKNFIAMIEEMTGRHVFYSEPAGELRSLELNKYYRVLLTYIRLETGHSDAFIHDYCKNYFEEAVKWKVGITPTTTDMTTSQMLQYFEWIKIHFTRLYPKMKWPSEDKIARPS